MPERNIRVALAVYEQDGNRSTDANVFGCNAAEVHPVLLPPPNQSSFNGRSKHNLDPQTTACSTSAKCDHTQFRKSSRRKLPPPQRERADRFEVTAAKWHHPWIRPTRRCCQPAPSVASTWPNGKRRTFQADHRSQFEPPLSPCRRESGARTLYPFARKSSIYPIIPDRLSDNPCSTRTARPA